jgi:hypothetical protein
MTFLPAAGVFSQLSTVDDSGYIRASEPQMKMPGLSRAFPAAICR